MVVNRPDPQIVKAGGKWYRLVVGLIHTKNKDGSPKLVTLVHDDETISLAGDEEFVTLYIPKEMVKDGQ